MIGTKVPIPVPLKTAEFPRLTRIPRLITTFFGIDLPTPHDILMEKLIMPHPQKPDNPPPPSGSPAGAWEEYCFSGDILFELIATAWRILERFRYRNQSLFTPQDAKDVVSEFRDRPSSKLTLVSAATPESLPAIGRNWFLLARLPTGGIHVRVFDVFGALIYDAPLPATKEAQPLRNTLRSLWFHRRLPAALKAQILLSVHHLTGVPVPGPFHKAIGELDPTFTPDQCKHYIIRALIFYVRAWRKRHAKNPRLSLDESLSGDAEDDAGGSRHSILADERSLPAHFPVIRRERARLFGLALDDLPASSQDTVVQALAELECKISKIAQLPKAPHERQRSHAALSDLAALVSSHEHAETLAGRNLISVFSRCLVTNLTDRQFAVDHFCRGLSIRQMSSQPDEAESIRRRLVRAARNLQPALDQRRAEAVRLLPRARRLNIQRLLEFGGKPTLELAHGFGCAPKDLPLIIRPILADMSMAFDVLIKRSSSTGRRALEKGIRKCLNDQQRPLATLFLLKKRSTWMAARMLGLTEEQGKERLYESLLALTGHLRSRLLNPGES